MQLIMDLWIYILINGIFFAIILTLYLLFIMIRYSPRIWGFSDYPKAITEKVPSQTKEEKKKAKSIYIFFLLIGLGFPIISTIVLENILYKGKIDFLTAFLNIFIIIMFGNIADLIILDIMIVGTLTPKFVIIPGTEDMKDKEYRDFRITHTITHIKGTIILILLSILIAIIMWIF